MADQAKPSLVQTLAHHVGQCAIAIAVTAGMTAYTAGLIGVTTAGYTVLGTPVTMGVVAAVGDIHLPLGRTFVDYSRVVLVGAGVFGAGYGAAVGLLSALGIVLRSAQLSALVKGEPAEGPSLLSQRALHAKQFLAGLVALPLGVAVVSHWTQGRLVQSVVAGGLLRPALCAAASNAMVYFVLKRLFNRGSPGGAFGPSPGEKEGSGSC